MLTGEQCSHTVCTVCFHIAVHHVTQARLLVKLVPVVVVVVVVAVVVVAFVVAVVVEAVSMAVTVVVVVVGLLHVQSGMRGDELDTKLIIVVVVIVVVVVLAVVMVGLKVHADACAVRAVCETLHGPHSLECVEGINVLHGGGAGAGDGGRRLRLRVIDFIKGTTHAG